MDLKPEDLSRRSGPSKGLYRQRKNRPIAESLPNRSSSLRPGDGLASLPPSRATPGLWCLEMLRTKAGTSQHWLPNHNHCDFCAEPTLMDGFGEGWVDDRRKLDLPTGGGGHTVPPDPCMPLRQPDSPSMHSNGLGTLMILGFSQHAQGRPELPLILGFSQHAQGRPELPLILGFSQHAQQWLHHPWRPKCRPTAPEAPCPSVKRGMSSKPRSRVYAPYSNH